MWSKLLRVVGGLEHRRFLPWSCDQIIPLLHYFLCFSTEQPLLITKRYMIVTRCKERLQPITPQPPSVSLHKVTPQLWQFFYTRSVNPFYWPYCSYHILKYRIRWWLKVDAIFSTSLPTVCKLKKLQATSAENCWNLTWLLVRSWLICIHQQLPCSVSFRCMLWNHVEIWTKKILNIGSEHLRVKLTSAFQEVLKMSLVLNESHE